MGNKDKTKCKECAKSRYAVIGSIKKKKSYWQTVCENGHSNFGNCQNFSGGGATVELPRRGLQRPEMLA